MPSFFKKNNTILSKGALGYCWQEKSFLTKDEATYGLRRLWDLVAGDATWEGAPVIILPAIERESVFEMFSYKPGAIQWIYINEVMPENVELQIDVDKLPALCMEATSRLTIRKKDVDFPLDLVAATFILLSRWEEYHIGFPLDYRGNPEESSLFPVRHLFHLRPVLDEWGIILRSWVRKYNPTWQAKLSEFTIIPTHDIDHLFRYPKFSCLPRRVIGSVLESNDLMKGSMVLSEGFRSIINPDRDPGFQLIKELALRNEDIGTKGIYFFMTAPTGKFDDGYNLINKKNSILLHSLSEKGHIVGWHPGYHAAEDYKEFIRQEANMKLSHTENSSKHVRMHYLRWRSHTLDWLEEIGATNDYSWGLNDYMGFSYGTSKPFPIWNISKNRQSSVWEIPLLVQDGPFATRMEKNFDKTISDFMSILSRTKKVNGIFTFLIHNNLVCSKIKNSIIADTIYKYLK